METAQGFMASTITLRIGSSKPGGHAASAIFCSRSTVRSWEKRERWARTIRANNGFNDFMGEEDITKTHRKSKRQNLEMQRQQRQQRFLEICRNTRHTPERTQKCSFGVTTLKNLCCLCFLCISRFCFCLLLSPR